MVSDMAVFLIVGSIAVTMYALHSGRGRKTTTPQRPAAVSAAPKPTEAPAPKHDPAVRREIEEFDLSFFADPRK